MPANDFDFLTGPFDVTNQRLTRPLTGSDDWEEFPATSIARLLFDGAVSIDEMHFPTRGFFGMSLRLFDPIEQTWTVHWVDSRNGILQAPVHGRWKDGVSHLFGPDEYQGRTILASYRWSDVTAHDARWEQQFSADDGKSWETNWIMRFTRRADMPPPSELPIPTSDFDFFRGDWQVVHQRLEAPLTNREVWTESRGTATSFTLFNGAVSIDEFDFPDDHSKGLTVRLFQPQTKTWTIYWVSSRDGRLQPPVSGTFDDGTGTFYGDDTFDGRPIKVRYIWTPGTGDTPHWEQAFSIDDGKSWETNWHMTFDHPASSLSPT